MIDLHTHSYYSDGTLSPCDLIRRAKEEGINVIALTDHDTIKGVEEARQEAALQGVQFVAGIEVSANDENHSSIHILGLNVRDLSAFDKLERENYASRKKRNQMILTGLKVKYNIDITYADLEICFKGTIGSGNIAQYLVKIGISSSYKEADKIVEQFKGAPYGVSVKTAIETIHRAGGVAFLAHPCSLHLNDKMLEETLIKWKSMGLDGVEYAHTKHTPEQTSLYQKLALKLGLEVSGGSDFHGDYKPDVKLAFGKGQEPLIKDILPFNFIKA